MFILGIVMFGGLCVNFGGGEGYFVGVVDDGSV